MRGAKALLKNISEGKKNNFAGCFNCREKEIFSRRRALAPMHEIILSSDINPFSSKSLLLSKIVWQDDYWATGVSEKHLEGLRICIRNQVSWGGDR